MSEFDASEKAELGGIYDIPGEGYVAELRLSGTSYLFDKQGLQYRIIQKKQKGYDVSAEQKALMHIHNLEQ